MNLKIRNLFYFTLCLINIINTNTILSMANFKRIARIFKKNTTQRVTFDNTLLGILPDELILLIFQKGLISVLNSCSTNISQKELLVEVNQYILLWRLFNKNFSNYKEDVIKMANKYIKDFILKNKLLEILESDIEKDFKDKEEEIIELIKKGARVNQRDKYGNTPLIVLAMRGSEKSVKYLIENKANINDKDILDQTVLMWSISRNFQEVVNLLISYNVDINTQDIDGNTPLMVATYSGYMDIIKLLFKNKVNINHKNKHKESALIIAISENKEDIARILIEHQDIEINIQDIEGNTPLIMAVLVGNINIAKRLLEINALVNLKNFKNQTALTIACQRGHANLVNLLLEYNADINAQDEQGYNALMIAIILNFNDIAKILILSRASLSLEDNDGNTARDLASIYENSEIVELIDARIKPCFCLLC